MYKNLIKSWIPNLTPNLMQEYGKKLGIFLNESETTILYQFIMKNYSEILEGNDKSLEELKTKLNPTLYKQLIKLYQENKIKYL